MAEYKSDVATINYDINLVYSKLSNPEALSKMAEMLPSEMKDKIQGLIFTADSITFQVPAAGNIELKATEKTEPTKIVYSATSSPVPFKLSIILEKIGELQTNGYAIIDIDIPVFLKPMVAAPLNQATAKFKELLTVIPYDKL